MFESTLNCDGQIHKYITTFFRWHCDFGTYTVLERDREQESDYRKTDSFHTVTTEHEHWFGLVWLTNEYTNSAERTDTRSLTACRQVCISILLGIWCFSCSTLSNYQLKQFLPQN